MMKYSESFVVVLENAHCVDSFEALWTYKRMSFHSRPRDKYK